MDAIVVQQNCSSDLKNKEVILSEIIGVLCATTRRSYTELFFKIDRQQNSRKLRHKYPNKINCCDKLIKQLHVGNYLKYIGQQRKMQFFFNFAHDLRRPNFKAGFSL